jgi:hypothetical protein
VAVVHHLTSNSAVRFAQRELMAEARVRVRDMFALRRDVCGIDR